MIFFDQILQARNLIRDHVLHTPLVHSATISSMAEATVFLKLENLQKTGSFKIRGATNKLRTRILSIAPGGVVAASAGNHAQGVALAAHDFGVKSTIVMPEWASISKQEATRSYGGNLVIYGKSVEESLAKAHEIAESGKTFIHPFDDEDIIAGQGTIALEIFDDLKDADVIIVPIGGGGLISGIAIAAKTIRPDVRIIGVQAAVCPSAVEARKNGKVRKVESSVSIADGICVKQVGGITFDFIREFVDDIVLVDEELIATAILTLMERKKILAEGAGAVPLAALAGGVASVPKGSKVVLVISGGNVDSPVLGRILRRGMMQKGRIMRIHVALSDTPGTLVELLDIIGNMKANILHIYHDRYHAGLPLNMTAVEIEAETRGTGHIAEIEHALKTAGYLSGM